MATSIESTQARTRDLERPAPERSDTDRSNPERSDPERSLGQLVSDASADASALVRGEIELAKVEIKNDVAHAGKGAGMFAGAAVFGAYGFGLLLLALAWLIAVWLPVWAGLLIVAVVLFVIAAVLALVGKKQITQVKGKPVKTIDNAQKTVAAVKPSK